MKNQTEQTQTRCDLDEIQDERIYFWAIAFTEIDEEIATYWQDFDPGVLLNFQEIYGIIDDFKDFTKGVFLDDDLEVFIAGKIWESKCQEDRICNVEFTVFLRKSPPTQHLFGIFS